MFINPLNRQGMSMDVVAAGQAYCSTRDEFSKVRGAQIAFGRTINRMSKKCGRDRVKEVLETPTKNQLAVQLLGKIVA